MIVVIDTNVIVSAFMESRGAPARVLRACASQAVTPVITMQLRSELERVLAYPRITRRLQIDDLTAWVPLSDYLALCSLVATTSNVARVTRDPDDDRVLEAAIDGRARYIITGDDDLLAVGSYQEIDIVSPAQFAAILDGMESP